jgi:hypothetical protein
MEPTEEPRQKKRRTSLSESCVICQISLAKILADNPVVQNPRIEGLKVILKAAELRKDDVYGRLFPVKDDILNGSTVIKFHQKCRANYTNKRNIQIAQSKTVRPCDDGATDGGATGGPTVGLSRLRRNDTSQFDIRSDCFICGKSHSWKEKLSNVSTGTGATTRQKVLNAAIQRNDDAIQMRMLANTDLFAMDAKYHRTCYSHYISLNNIKAACATAKLDSSDNESAFTSLCREIEDTVLSKTTSITTLAVLHERFVAIVSADVNCKTHTFCTTWRLKEKLQKHFGDRISFISQPGKSDLVCSGDITVAEALKHVVRLQLHVNESGECELESSDDVNSEEDSVVLHKAAGIIRKCISGITFQSERYDPSGKLDTKKCKDFVPNRLFDFIGWCTSKKDFDSATTYESETDMRNIDMRVLAICHNVISLGCKSQTPITFGLGVKLHHDHGSREQIDDLFCLGHSISYDEVRKFITAIALDQLLNQSELYIPRDISVYDPENVQTTVDAAIDNFDQNEETIDGKNTTHSMAVVLYQRCPRPEETPCIPRTNQKTLEAQACDDEIKRYNKPHAKPEPCVKWEDKKPVKAKSVVQKDLIWEIARASAPETSQVPAWSGFNALVSDGEIPQTRILYLPFINAPPSDFSTIYTTLLKLVETATALGQEHILVTADLAIYSKAVQILWTEPDPLAGRVTMRLGGMHLTMSFMASIGKLFSDGGLHNMLTDSEVYAAASVTLMLQGKQYARGLRGIRLVHEALFHLFLSGAESFAVKHKLPWLDDSTVHLIRDLQHAFKTQSSEACSAVCQEIEMSLSSSLLSTLDKFKATGREQSATFRYWLSFLEAGDTLLKLLRADREADFQLHLAAVLEVIPYFFLGGRSNYARYTPVYLAEMHHLETAAPKMFEHMSAGGFVVKRSERTFNCVPTDQALEQSINREAKSQGGVIGYTRRKGALVRWLVTRHITAEYAERFHEMCSSKKSKNLHEELGSARMTKDQKDVQKIKDFIKDCQDPFDIENVPVSLVNITSGQVASKEVEESMKGVPEKGQDLLNQFTKERLGEERKKSFWDPIPKAVVVKTFSSMKKCLSSDKDRKIMINTEVLFRRLLAVSNNRDVDMRKVLSYELAAVPPSMFHDDGSMRKTNKSDLAKKLEANADEMLVLPQPDISTSSQSAYLIDGMAMCQALNENHFKTFNDLGKVVLKRAVRLMKNSDMDPSIDVVTLVFDRYDREHSIKSTERQRRGMLSSGLNVYQIQGNRDVPNYRNFLKSSANKASLAAFISRYICDGHDLLPAEKSVVLAGGFEDGEVVKVVNKFGVSSVDELCSTQEEADTRLVLHAIALSRDHQRIIIRCDDTDVLVLLLYYSSMGSLANEVYMHAGHSGKFVTKERFIPVHQISTKLGSVCKSLPAAHALSGCDTTSSLYKLGKKTAYSALTKNAEALQSLEAFDDVPKFLDAARRFVLFMHGKKTKNLNSLNDLRFMLATTTDKPATMLPPTEDAFEQHVLRAQYQVAVWCQSHIAKPADMEPVGHGWHVNEGELCTTMYLNESAPAEVRDITHLYCTDKGCRGQKCQCVIAGLECIDICTCGGECENKREISEVKDGDEVGDMTV